MSSTVTSAKTEFCVSGGKYRLVRKIGSGSFGDIYLGLNNQSGEVSFVALHGCTCCSCSSCTCSQS